MRKGTFTAIIVLMSLSIIGIGALEWYWVSTTVSEQRIAFDKAVRTSASGIISELEVGATEAIIEEQFGEWDFFESKLREAANAKITSDSVRLLVKVQSEAQRVQAEQLRREAIMLHSKNIDSHGSHKPVLKGSNQVIIAEDSMVAIYTTQELGDSAIQTRYRQITVNNGDTIENSLIERNVGAVSDALKQVLIRRVYEQPTISGTLANRNTDSLIAHNLKSEGIDAPFEFAFVESNTDSLNGNYARTSLTSTDAFEYRFPIFPERGSEALLLLHFPEKDTAIMKSLAWVMAGVVLFTLLMMGTFGSTIFFMLRQKRLSEVKNDFINNMTHEFKTPLATIGIAADSIRHPLVSGNPAEVSRLSEMILEEKKRLTGHVEKILLAAKMDRGSLPLQKTMLSMNDLAREAANSMQMQASATGGKIGIELSDVEPTVCADKVHIVNALVNLLDNALKYAKEKPVATIKVEIRGLMVRATVSDNGIGMSAEVQRKAFETFYRAEGGNTHNVKGFGLGLSYVREVINLHSGKLIIDSTPGKGSTVGFEIPIAS
jgi:two-component system phosphate regulon sensor histidine kinase PhoR